MNVQQAFRECKIRLAEAGIEDPSFEAQCLVKKSLGFDRLALIAHGGCEIDDSRLSQLNALTQRRIAFEPLQYILGSWSFCGFEFFVGEGVLIPRDDTEVAVNLCIDFLSKRQNRKTIDLCAGSGAISVALDKIAGADVTALELSQKAFEYLNKNILYNNSKVRAIMGDIFECHSQFNDGEYDLIVSNPPYIKTDEIPSLQAEVQKEPAMALDGGADGYDFYRAIVKLWSKKLKKGGALVFELGENQAEYVSSLMKANGFENIHTSLDLGNVQRAIIGTLQAE